MPAAGALARVLIERYRSPEALLKLGLIDSLPEKKDFFRYGPRIICYGSFAHGRDRSNSLYDAAEDSVARDSNIFLSFDPSEVADNLRMERYVPAVSAFRSSAKKAYYLSRPLLPPFFRKQIQRFQLRDWEKISFPNWPLDTTVEDLCEALLLEILKARGDARIPFIWFWPEGKSGCFVMTHDVESATGRDQCFGLMDLDDSFGIKASFQVVPLGRYAVTPRYLDTIRSRGFEIAVQDFNHDGKLFDERGEFLRRAGRINQYASDWGARGFRSGVLYRKPDWYDAFEVSLDMSVPNVAHLDPQRGGCCTVMPYFIGDVLELPLTTTQDYMLVHLLKQSNIDLWKRQISAILNKNGFASFIVHPDYVDQGEARSLYKNLLGYIKELRTTANIWCALPSEVDRWWRARSKMTLVSDGNGWKVTGDGSERACVAYARNVDGKLVYELQPAFLTRPAAQS